MICMSTHESGGHLNLPIGLVCRRKKSHHDRSKGDTTVRTLLMEGERDMGNCCEELLMMCLDKGSKDNMSATIVSFPAARCDAPLWFSLKELD